MARLFEDLPEYFQDLDASAARSASLDRIAEWASGEGEGARAAARPTRGDDRLQGSEEADVIDALAGNDEVSGKGGDDELDGGAGDDTLRGGDGNDTLVDLKGANALYGGAGNDEITGGRKDDRLFGDAGADDIDGGRGDDLIHGGADSDLLLGGDGNDTIVGGGGADLMTGGAGRDLFVVEGGALVVVSIADIEIGRDRIEFSGVRGVESFADLKVEHGNCGIMIYDKSERISVALVNYFGAVDEGDFLFS